MIPFRIAALGGITRLCPDCQVASTEDACWLCGVVVTDPELHGAVSIRNPTGPLPAAIGTSLDL